MKPYTPGAGTIAARTIELLQQTGGRLSATDIGQQLGTPRNNVRPSLVAPVSRGLLAYGKDHDGQMRYSLPQDAGYLTPAPTKKTRKTSIKRAARPAPDHVADAGKKVDADDPFRCALWDDGDITLHGCTLTEGDGVILTQAQARRLAGFLEGAGMGAGS